MLNVVKKKLLLVLLVLLVLAPPVSYLRESYLQRQALDAYDSTDLVALHAAVSSLWFTSAEDKATILSQARAFAWYGEFKFD